MASDLSNSMLEKLRKHFETGVPIERMTFTPDQRKRITMCMEAYKRFATDPYMDIHAYMRNRFNRTYSELKNDIKLIDYIASFFEGGSKNIAKMQVRHAARVMMKNGQETGNMKAMNDGARLIFNLEHLDQPDSPEDMSEDLAKMPIVVTVDVNKKFANKHGHNEEEMRRIRKRWGVTQDHWQREMEERSEIQDVEFEEADAAESAEAESAEAESAAPLSMEREVVPQNETTSDDSATDDDSTEKDSTDYRATDDDDEDDFDAEIDAIIASDLKAHEERKKKK